ncbi:hypothetical protein JCM5350_000261 [Sporobolomyces pararoseus]
MRSLATFAAAATLLLASPSLATFSLPAEDSTSIFSRSTSENNFSSYHFDERSGILTEYAPSSLTSDLKKRDTFPATFGLMLERDVSIENARFQKRSKLSGGEREIVTTAKRARDVGKRQVVEIELTKRGELVLPQSHQVQKRSSSSKKKKQNKKQKKVHTKKMNKVTRSNKSNNKKKSSTGNLQSSSSNGIQRSLVKLASSIPKISAYITWYTGVDLQKPYCADKSGWTPKDSSLIAAVTLDWGKNRPACGSFLQLKSPKNNKSVIVRTVDMCGGCAPGIAHVDLSKAAFTALFSLDVGKVSDIEVSTLAGPPFKTWTSSLKALYGPEVL